jgi:hypothetical protein
MKGDLHPAALRLSQQLPSRTHIAKVRNPQSPQANPWSRIGDAARVRRPKVITGRGRGGLNRRPMLIEGVRYDSMREATKATGRSYKTIYKWLDEGTATYIKESKEQT